MFKKIIIFLLIINTKIFAFNNDKKVELLVNTFENPICATIILPTYMSKLDKKYNVRHMELKDIVVLRYWLNNCNNDLKAFYIKSYKLFKNSKNILSYIESLKNELNDVYYTYSKKEIKKNLIKSYQKSLKEYEAFNIEKLATIISLSYELEYNIDYIYYYSALSLIKKTWKLYKIEKNNLNCNSNQIFSFSDRVDFIKKIKSGYNLCKVVKDYHYNYSNLIINKKTNLNYKNIHKYLYTIGIEDYGFHYCHTIPYDNYSKFKNKIIKYFLDNKDKIENSIICTLFSTRNSYYASGLGNFGLASFYFELNSIKSYLENDELSLKLRKILKFSKTSLFFLDEQH